MKKATLKLSALVVMICGASAVANAQTSASNNINVVTTAVPFLRISPDARSTGMGETVSLHLLILTQISGTWVKFLLLRKHGA